MKEKRYSVNEGAWYGDGLNPIRCPHPECAHIGNIITKAHCKMYHDMSREDVGRLYGPPIKAIKRVKV